MISVSLLLFDSSIEKNDFLKIAFNIFFSVIMLCSLMTIANWIFFCFCNFWLKRSIKLLIVTLFDVQIRTREWLMRLIAFVIFKQNDITNFKTIVILLMTVDSIINFTSLNKTCAYLTTFIYNELKCWICRNVIISKEQCA